MAKNKLKNFLSIMKTNKKKIAVAGIIFLVIAMIIPIEVVDEEHVESFNSVGAIGIEYKVYDEDNERFDSNYNPIPKETVITPSLGLCNTIDKRGYNKLDCYVAEIREAGPAKKDERVLKEMIGSSGHGKRIDIIRDESISKAEIHTIHMKQCRVFGLLFCSVDEEGDSNIQLRVNDNIRVNVYEQTCDYLHNSSECYEENQTSEYSTISITGYLTQQGVEGDFNNNKENEVDLNFLSWLIPLLIISIPIIIFIIVRDK